MCNLLRYIFFFYLSNHTHTPFLPLFSIPGQSQWKKAPKSHIKGLPARNHPLRRRLQPAYRKHLHIQVSPPFSRLPLSNIPETVCVPESVGRLPL